MCAARFVDSNVTSSGSDNRNLLLIPYGSVHVNYVRLVTSLVKLHLWPCIVDSLHMTGITGPDSNNLDVVGMWNLRSNETRPKLKTSKKKYVVISVLNCQAASSSRINKKLPCAHKRLDKHVAQGRADFGLIDFGHTLEDEEDEDGDG